jgi:hypothetical protein
VVECYERKHAILPQQALALHNNELVRRQARKLTRQLSKQAKDTQQFVEMAFESLLTRRPTSAELTECQIFLDKMTRFNSDSNQSNTATQIKGEGPSPDPTIRSREQLVHVLMNHHEFVTIR